ncbi:MAG: putative glycoside hydrolase [Patescibacteria group bacterium]
MNRARQFKIAGKKMGISRARAAWFFVFAILVLAVFVLCYFILPSYLSTSVGLNVTRPVATSTSIIATAKDPKAEFVATHVPTPSSVKAIYMTSWVAGSKDLRSKLVNIIDTTEINSVVIDIKDYSGRIAFSPDDPYLKEIGAFENRIPDAREFIADLHRRGIYVIGRISTFQDAYLVKLKPTLAVKRESDGAVWKDYKGISWIDPGSKEEWKYITAIGAESYKAGFDELNFDYIRFPSDGNMKDIAYPYSGKNSKPTVLRDFFAYLNTHLKPMGAVLSADLFGMTTTNTDDLGIGQVLENALPYFDYVAPMVYPSHYPPTFMGFKNPADKPYEVVKFSMDAAVRRSIATTTKISFDGSAAIASTSPKLYPKEEFSQLKIRPWLQDFNLGATYTAEMVDKQIQATYDSGLNSWMLWNASNHYTVAALKVADAVSVNQ